MLRCPKKSLPVLALLIVLVLPIACKEDDDVAPPRKMGVVEEYYSSHKSDFLIEPINGIKFVYDVSSAVTRRGMFFNVEKEVRVKAIGGQLRKAGDYHFELVAFPAETLYSTTVTVKETGIFVFQKVEQDIRLKPETQYILRYCDPNHHDSVYDMYLTKPSDEYLTAFDFGVIKMRGMAYDYTYQCVEGYSSNMWNTSLLLMRGIVDLQVEEI